MSERMNDTGGAADQNKQTAIAHLLTFIPLLESGALTEVHTAYITTGEYAPPVRDLLQAFKAANLAPESHDWVAWSDQARPYLQEPARITSADDETFARLLSLATFSERFNKSLFPHLCASGFMLHLLKRLQASVIH